MNSFIRNLIVGDTSLVKKDPLISGESANAIIASRSNFVNELDILGCHIDQVPLYINNNLALSLTKNLVFYAKTKHLNFHYY
jgi:hypothetical protein